MKSRSASGKYRKIFKMLLLMKNGKQSSLLLAKNTVYARKISGFWIFLCSISSWPSIRSKASLSVSLHKHRWPPQLPKKLLTR